MVQSVYSLACNSKVLTEWLQPLTSELICPIVMVIFHLICATRHNWWVGYFQRVTSSSRDATWVVSDIYVGHSTCCRIAFFTGLGETAPHACLPRLNVRCHVKIDAILFKSNRSPQLFMYIVSLFYRNSNLCYRGVTAVVRSCWNIIQMACNTGSTAQSNLYHSWSLCMNTRRLRPRFICNFDGGCNTKVCL